MVLIEIEPHVGNLAVVVRLPHIGNEGFQVEKIFSLMKDVRIEGEFKLLPLASHRHGATDFLAVEKDSRIFPWRSFDAQCYSCLSCAFEIGLIKSKFPKPNGFFIYSVVDMIDKSPQKLDAATVRLCRFDWLLRLIGWIGGALPVDKTSKILGFKQLSMGYLQGGPIRFPNIKTTILIHGCYHCHMPMVFRTGDIFSPN